jgi:hypothetical protein
MLTGLNTVPATNQPKPTMKLVSRVAAFALTAAAAATTLQADTNSVSSGKNAKQPVPIEAPTPAFTGAFTAAYDSMYNFRGIDWIPNTGIFDFTLAPSWHITANDTLTMPLWFCVAVAQNNYPRSYNSKPYTEFDIPINYLHTFGNFGLGCGYTMYNYFNYGFPAPGTTYKPGGTGIQHEVNVTANYTVKTGAVAWTPSLTYYYELGQAAPYNYASINAGSSFLTPALAASVPLYKDIVSFNPVTQYNLSFGYNVNTAGQKVYGFNNWQLVAPVTWKITSAISFTAYAAYTYQPDLMNSVTLTQTPISKFYCGASVGYAF